MSRIGARLELTANIAIIAVCGLLTVAVIQRYFVTQSPRAAQRPPLKLSLVGVPVDWATNKTTLLVAISSNCRFCTESAPFLQGITRPRVEFKVVFLMHEPISAGQAYLQSLGVESADVREVSFQKVGVRATPTFIVVDAKGQITRTWEGRLPSTSEKELAALLTASS